MNISRIRFKCLFLIISFCTLLLLSPDSYTHDLFDRIDSGWFFTCGKAWMNGMVPYVDFADSKGPLLWLIYGIAYLISSDNYLGVLFISIFLYSTIFYYVFKTANIFLTDLYDSIIVVLMMIASFFCRWYHYEIRAEDFNLLFVSILFYRMCFLLYTDEGKENKKIYLTCFLVGISLSATLFIKYNASVMIGLVTFYLFYALIREKKPILISLSCLAGGCLFISLPILLYMIHIGNFEAFVQEYFFNTMQTIDSYNNLKTYFKEWLFLTYETQYIVIFFISFIGSILMKSLVCRYTYFFPISFLCFYSISIHHSASNSIQYMGICLFFPIWICIIITKYTKRHAQNYKKKISLFVVIILAYTFISNMFNQGYLCSSLFFNDNDGRQSYYKTAYFLSQINKPTIIFFGDLERGIGTPANALPGSKYWSLQKHATKDMIIIQKHDVLKGTSDFILTSNFDSSLSMKAKDSLLSIAGYHEVYRSYYGVSTHYLYSKHQLKPLPVDFHVSNLDVLLKINPLKKYK